MLIVDKQETLEVGGKGTDYLRYANIKFNSQSLKSTNLYPRVWKEGGKTGKTTIKS